MKIADREILLCNCGDTMPLDPAAIQRAASLAGLSEELPRIHRYLCGDEIASLRQTIRQGSPCLVACTQEIGRLRRAADEAGGRQLLDFVNIREAAGWSQEAPSATPKMLALLAAATIEVPEPELVELACGQGVLVYGRDETALAAAERLHERCDVTLVLDPATPLLLPSTRTMPVHLGRARIASGHIGAFLVVFDWHGEAPPWSRNAELTTQPERASRRFDLVLDLSGGTPWFPDHRRRLGYLRPDPAHAAAVERALFDLVNLFGTIAKPRYVTHEAALCGHASGGKVGCTRCLDVCPTGAIVSAGGTIDVDAATCAGCGSCAAACPTEAMTYAAPPGTTTRWRLATLLTTYLAADGVDPVVLVHSTARGEELINALARLGDGLPAHVLPLAVRQPTQLGLDFHLAGLVLGARGIVIQVDPEHEEETVALRQQIDLANRTLEVLGWPGERVRLCVTGDPDALSAALATPEVEAIAAMPSLDVTTRKSELIRVCLEYLKGLKPAGPTVLAAAPGAPFGAVTVGDACTICHACVRACPTGALGGDPRQLTLSFEEASCVQCALCAAVCPEQAITLSPRLSLSEEALMPRIVRSDEPAVCPQCGTQFGSRQAIARVTTRLEQAGWSGQNPALAARLAMCETCRVTVQ